MLGLVLMVTTVLAVQIALGLVFDPRYRDFHFRRADVSRGAVRAAGGCPQTPQSGGHARSRRRPPPASPITRRSISSSTSTLAELAGRPGSVPGLFCLRHFWHGRAPREARISNPTASPAKPALCSTRPKPASSEGDRAAAIEGRSR